MARNPSGIVTTRDHWIERFAEIKEPKDFKDEKSFEDEFGKLTVAPFTVINQYFREKCSLFRMSQIIFEFLGKYPQSKDRIILADLVSRIIYNEYYLKAHSHYITEMPPRVKYSYEEAIKSVSYDKTPIFKKEKKKRKNTRKGTDIGDEVAQKLREMTSEDMLIWEKELGVDKATIKKQKAQLESNKGIGRMQIGRKIRSILDKKKKTDQK